MKNFTEVLGGMLWAIRSWEQWEDLQTFLEGDAANGWYVYFVGQELPKAPLDESHFRRVLGALDSLLRHDHRERYLGIVYVDDRESPSLVKIYDPNNLGASCGSSGKWIPPGWILSRMPPAPVAGPLVIPEGRLRWWRELFSERGA